MLAGDYHIVMDPKVPSVQHARHQVLVALKTKLREKYMN